ncbi:hypothetical protein SAMN06265795_103188 [Noviherbaspirillum humi]|uniref:Uncharacterized protein n=1 Tax=Noviherbaspirillum humi TaxID=1688639 RepID=A0A239F5N2_9BURK|nr:hypothetical protein [Noviherbaspirillum humi]SNS52051.1 hypothetical protein SAMN06265795_103188 [Noviherbaspirillum humi]
MQDFEYELEWDGPGAYVLVPATVHYGEAMWDQVPIPLPITNSVAELEHELEEHLYVLEALGDGITSIWRKGGVIYKSATEWPLTWLPHP